MVHLAQYPESLNPRSIGVAVVLDVAQQGLRILRCTARAMAGSPGGLRFKPGAQPWLDGLTPIRPDGKPAPGAAICL